LCRIYSTTQRIENSTTKVTDNCYFKTTCSERMVSGVAKSWVGSVWDGPLHRVWGTLKLLRDATIEERPVPPGQRLSFPYLLLNFIQNPLAAWSEDFYRDPIVVYRAFGKEVVFVMDPDLIQTILSDDLTNYSKSPLYDEVLGAGGGEGLLITEGEKWKWQRRLMAPMFRPHDVTRYLPDFVAGGQRLLARWCQLGQTSVQEIDGDVAASTLELLVGTILGSDIDERDRKQIAACAATYLKHSRWKIARASLKLPSWSPHPGMLRMRAAAKTVRRISAKALTERRRRGDQRDDLLGLLMAAQDPSIDERMRDSLIVDNLVTFLLAGHETTAKSLTWALHAMALLPEWQEIVRAEVLAVTAGEPLGAKQVAELKLLERFFLESMRLYPPAPSIMRVSREAATLGDETIGAGAVIVIPIYVVHRHREVWPNPLRFDPERFGPECSHKRHRFAYLPFGAGPRGCIGGSYSMLEAKTMLATLLAGARFSLPAGELPVPVARITLHSKANIALRVTPV